MNQYLDEIDSTQLELKRRLAADPQLTHLSCIHARTQTGGKGRQDRQWFSPAGNFYFSVLLRGPHESVTWVPLWVATCLKRAIEETFPLQKKIKLKWPNDLIVEPFSKLSGILCEKVGDHVVAGIGVNVLVTPEVQGREVISVQDLVQNQMDSRVLELLKEALLSELSQTLQIHRIQADFEKDSLTPFGETISWLDVGTQKEGSGTVLGLGPYGDLKVKVGEQEQSLLSEEVTAVKKS
jgi:biotin-[acetyl-CoA-carboxylase] ligase BirA-like protein